MKITIAGRTRSGKSALANALSRELGLKKLKTSTNRPRRWPEEEGYHFYAKEESDRIPLEDKLTLTTGLDGYERWTCLTDILAADIAILDDKGFPVAIQAYRNAEYPVLFIYVNAGFDSRKSAVIADAREHGSDIDAAVADFLHRDGMETAQFDAIEQKIREWPAAGMGMSLYGETVFIDWHNDFTPEDMDRITATVRILQERIDGLTAKT